MVYLELACLVLYLSPCLEQPDYAMRDVVGLFIIVTDYASSNSEEATTSPPSLKNATLVTFCGLEIDH